MADFYLHSQRVVTPSGVVPGFVRVRDGRILCVDVLPEKGVPLMTYGNLILSPGLVDTHAHLNEPGRTEWEGFETATRAAASGGVTTIVDMPLNCVPATTTRVALETKRRAVKDHAWVDYGFWGGVVPGNEAELDPMMDSGVCGFKAFLIDSGVREFEKADKATLLKAMPRLARRRVPLLVHAELDRGDVSAHDSRKYIDYLRSRPRTWEEAAIKWVIVLAQETVCPIHIVHLSDALSLPLIAQARSRGMPISVETCPHYLVFAAETIADGQTHFKCAPPIREEANRELLWKGVLSGAIDCVVSDHSPCTPALKGLESGDFHKAWGGIAGIQFLLGSVWTEAAERGWPLSKLFRAMAQNTARLAGLSHKGAILPGNDADLILWDPEEQFVVETRQVLHRHSLTPYAGRTLRGSVKKTWVRGQLVYDEGHFSAPVGREVRRGERP